MHSELTHRVVSESKFNHQHGSVEGKGPLQGERLEAGKRREPWRCWGTLLTVCTFPFGMCGKAIRNLLPQFKVLEEHTRFKIENGKIVYPMDTRKLGP